MAINYKTLGDRIKTKRISQGITQEKFAEVVGSNLVFINQIENLKRKPTIEMLDKIATNLNKYDKNLNISSSDLIKFDITHMTNYSRIDEKK